MTDLIVLRPSPDWPRFLLLRADELSRANWAAVSLTADSTQSAESRDSPFVGEGCVWRPLLPLVLRESQIEKEPQKSSI